MMPRGKWSSSVDEEEDVKPDSSTETGNEAEAIEDGLEYIRPEDRDIARDLEFQGDAQNRCYRQPDPEVAEEETGIPIPVLAMIGFPFCTRTKGHEGPCRAVACDGDEQGAMGNLQAVEESVTVHEEAVAEWHKADSFRLALGSIASGAYELEEAEEVNRELEFEGEFPHEIVTEIKRNNGEISDHQSEMVV